jgi:hypothetical protein
VREVLQGWHSMVWPVVEGGSPPRSRCRYRSRARLTSRQGRTCMPDACPSAMAAVWWARAQALDQEQLDTATSEIPQVARRHGQCSGLGLKGENAWSASSARGNIRYLVRQ